MEPSRKLGLTRLPANGMTCEGQESTFYFKYIFPLWRNVVSEISLVQISSSELKYKCPSKGDTLVALLLFKILPRA